MDLREQLQTTLDGTYRLERELGGGGMSRVFVADELRLGRKVVIKVLSPELAAGISANASASSMKPTATVSAPHRITRSSSRSGSTPTPSCSRASRTRSGVWRG